METQLEAWINVIENIKEDFEHDIREIKEQLAKLTKLVERHIKSKSVDPQCPSSLPL